MVTVLFFSNVAGARTAMSLNGGLNRTFLWFPTFRLRVCPVIGR